MSIFSPLCWLSGGHEWEVFLETKNKVVLKCRFCGALKTIIK